MIVLNAFLAWDIENLTSASAVERERGCSRNLEMKIMSYFK
jgi:hypothetical protein